MRDYAMLLEETIEKYWGAPKSSIYFSNYYGDSFEMRAILFSIILFEINYNFKDYKEEELNILREYENKYTSEVTTFEENVRILEFLAKHKTSN